MASIKLVDVQRSAMQEVLVWGHSHACTEQPRVGLEWHKRTGLSQKDWISKVGLDWQRRTGWAE